MSCMRDKKPGWRKVIVVVVACYRLHFPAWGNSPRCDTAGPTLSSVSEREKPIHHNTTDLTLLWYRTCLHRGIYMSTNGFGSAYRKTKGNKSAGALGVVAGPPFWDRLYI